MVQMMLVLSLTTQAQQDRFGWRVGLYGGATSYYGELSNKLIDPNLKLIDPIDNLDFATIGVSIEKSMSKAWGMRFMATKGSFIANDRAINWSKELQTGNENFHRSLNVKTDIKDLALIFVYHFDNGKLFGNQTFLSPYLMIGGGVTKFKTYADLYNNNNRYHYWGDNTIRNIAEADPNAANASIIEQDGIFETELTDLQTEGVDYVNQAIQIPFGVGLKFRLGARLNLNIESLWRYTSTDYLDDVGGNSIETVTDAVQAYAANPAGLNSDFRATAGNDLKDIYAFHSISLHYNFGRKKNAFTAPIIMTSDLYQLQEPVMEMEEEIVDEKEVLVEEEINELPVLEEVEVEIDREIVEEKKIRAPIEIVKEETTPIFEEDMEEGQVVVKNNSTQEEVVVEIENVDQLTKREEAILKAETEKIKVDNTTIVDKKEADIPTREKVIVVERTVDTSKEQDAVSEELAELRREVKELRAEREAVKSEKSTAYLSKKNLIVDENQSEEISRLKKDLKDLRDDQAKENKALVKKMRAEYQDEVNILLQKMKLLEMEMNRKVENKTTYIQTPANSNNDNSRDFDRIQDDLNSINRRLDYTNDTRQSNQGNRNTGEVDDLRRKIIILESMILDQKNTPAPKVESNQDDRSEVESLNRQMEDLQRQIASMNQDAKVITVPVPAPSSDRPSASEYEVRRMAAELEALKTALKEERASKANLTNQNQEMVKMNAQLLDMQKQMKEMEKTTPTVAPPPPPRVVAPATVVTTVDPNAYLRDVIRGKEINHVFFNSGSHTINTQARNTINNVAQLALSHSALDIRLEGYTDKTGNPDANLVLSKKRAESVRQQLLQLGLPAHRIVSEFHGQDNQNDPAFGRRVEMRLLIRR